jgi:hypothetical protein
MRTTLINCLVLSGALCSLGSAGCGSGVNSDEQARRAYVGLDAAIDKAINLGFAGFNAASSANIPAQMTTGTAAGTLKVTGQVDQGASNNKGMRLVTDFTGYSDDTRLFYVTVAGKTQELNMQLKGIPTGTLDGDANWTLDMTGELAGQVTLKIVFAGTLQSGGGNIVQRKPGTTRITGTATSGPGVYTIDVTR